MSSSVKAKSDREKKRRILLTAKLNELSDRVFEPQLLKCDSGNSEDEERCDIKYLKKRNVNRTELLAFTTDLLLKLHKKNKAKGETISQLKRKESELLSMRKGKPSSQRRQSDIKENPSKSSLPEPCPDNVGSITIAVSSGPPYQLSPGATPEEVQRILLRRSVSAATSMIGMTPQTLALSDMRFQNPALLTSLLQHRRNAEFQRLGSLGMPHLLQNPIADETLSMMVLNNSAPKDPPHRFKDRKN